MGSTGGSLHPTPSEGVHLRRCFALRVTDSSPSAPPINPNEDMQKHEASGRTKEKREKTEFAPEKQKGGTKRSRKSERRAGWKTPLVSPHPNERSKRKVSQERAPLSPLFALRTQGTASRLRRKEPKETQSRRVDNLRGVTTRTKKREEGKKLKGLLLLSKKGDEVTTEIEHGSKER